jgi:transcriptional regulator with XRE-family HTH domain
MPDSRLWTFIDERLRAKGWRPADLARASKVSESRLSAWRNQGAEPTIANARAVAEALNEPLVCVLVAAGVLTDDEARHTLSTYTLRELHAEIESRFERLIEKVPGERVTHHTTG